MSVNGVQEYLVYMYVGEDGASCHRGKLSHQHYLLNIQGKSSIMSSVLQPMLKVGQGIPSRSHCAARKTDTENVCFRLLQCHFGLICRMTGTQQTTSKPIL